MSRILSAIDKDERVLESMDRGKRPPRVLEIITALDIGGAEVQLLRRASIFTESGLDVTVCSLKRGGALREALERLDVRVVELDSRALLDPRPAMQLLALMRRRRPDVVHCHLFRARLWGVLAARLARVRVIVQTEHMLTRATFEARPHTPVNRLAGLVLGRLAHVTVAISPDTSRALRRIHRVPGHKIAYVPNGIPLRDFQPTNAAPCVDVTALGRLHELKGFRDLVEALAMLRHFGETVSCEIAGDGPLRKELQRHIDSSGLSESVRLVGPKVDAAAFIRRGRVFAMPSRAEGFGVAALEAMAVGVPVVASGVDGLADLIKDGHTGILVPPASPAKLAGALRMLLRNDELRAELSRRALDTAAAYGLEDSTDRLIEIYRRAWRRADDPSSS